MLVFSEVLRLRTVSGSEPGKPLWILEDLSVFRFSVNFGRLSKNVYWTDSNNFLFFGNVSMSFVHFCTLLAHWTWLRYLRAWEIETHISGAELGALWPRSGKKINLPLSFTRIYNRFWPRSGRFFQFTRLIYAYNFNLPLDFIWNDKRIGLVNWKSFMSLIIYWICYR